MHTAHARQVADAYTVPSRKMWRIVTVFMNDDGEGAHENEGDTGTDRGDLVPLETGSLGLGLGGGLKGQNAWVTWKRSVKYELGGRVVKRIPYVKQPMATLWSKGWNLNQPREAGSLLKTISHVDSAKTCGRGVVGSPDTT